MLDSVSRYTFRPGVNLATAQFELPTRAVALYHGEFRRLDQSDAGFLAFFLRTLYPQAPVVYQNAVHLSADGLDYWIPVQESLRRDFLVNAASGDSVQVFVLYHGVYTVGRDTTARRVLGITAWEARSTDRAGFQARCP